MDPANPRRAGVVAVAVALVMAAVAIGGCGGRSPALGDDPGNGVATTPWAVPDAAADADAASPSTTAPSVAPPFPSGALDERSASSVPPLASAPSPVPRPTPAATPRPVPTPDLASIEQLIDVIADALADDAAAPADEGRP